MSYSETWTMSDGIWLTCMSCGKAYRAATETAWPLCFYCENHVDEETSPGSASAQAARCRDIRPETRGDGRIVRKAIT